MRRNLHSANLTCEATSKERGAGAMDQKEILLYVSHPSWRSWRTRRLLRRRGYHFKVLDTSGHAQLCSWLATFTGRKTLPYVFVDHRPVGGLGEIRTLERSGVLEHLVRGEL
jgi:glutaredoxin